MSTLPSCHPTPRRIAPVFPCLVLALSLVLPARAAEPAPLKLLTIGNSFSQQAFGNLPEMARTAGHPLLMVRANLGGHTLQQHAEYLQEFETNPNAPGVRRYKGKIDPRTGETKDFALPELLQAADWDFVTIQQASPLSYKEDSYEPWAGILVAAIHKYAPHAKILVFQTWAYREDYPGFTKKEGFTQQTMFERVKAACAKLAERHGLRVIPVGEAFQAARRLPRWTFTFPDADFDYKNPPANAVPRQPGSLNAGWIWLKNKTTGQKEFELDYRHLNNDGRYLGAAVIFETLFGEDVRAVNYTLKSMTEADAKELRRIAHEAAASASKQISKSL